MYLRGVSASSFFCALTLLMTCPARPDTIPVGQQWHPACTKHALIIPRLFVWKSRKKEFSRSRSAGKCPLNRGVFVMVGYRGGGAGSSGASPC